MHDINALGVFFVLHGPPEAAGNSLFHRERRILRRCHTCAQL